MHGGGGGGRFLLSHPRCGCRGGGVGHFHAMLCRAAGPAPLAVEGLWLCGGAWLGVVLEEVSAGGCVGGGGARGGCWGGGGGGGAPLSLGPCVGRMFLVTSGAARASALMWKRSCAPLAKWGNAASATSTSSPVGTGYLRLGSGGKGGPC